MRVAIERNAFVCALNLLFPRQREKARLNVTQTTPARTRPATPSEAGSGARGVAKGADKQ
jgi:hypothetical protein